MSAIEKAKEIYNIFYNTLMWATEPTDRALRSFGNLKHVRLELMLNKINNA